MERILAILTDEQDYARELAKYLSSRSDFIFKPMIFSDIEAYMHFDNDNHVDMLLCSEEYAAHANSFKAENICILSECSAVADRLDTSWEVIFKYQSSFDIMQSLIDAYGRKKLQVDQTATSEGPHIISIFSPIGGCGASTYALALAEYYARGGKTLFLSFDPFFLFPFETKNPKDKNLSDLFYYLEASKDNAMIARSIPGLIERIAHQKGSLDYVTGVSHWFDLIETPLPAVNHLRRALCGTNRYGRVVIDLGVTGSLSMEVMAASHEIHVPVKPGKNYELILDEWRRQMTFAGQGSLLKKVREVSIPRDESIEGQYQFEQLLKGRLGAFIEEQEGLGYVR